ncbi:MAG: GNAT family N-acetyltransferase [candidate division Zixibacteria bacterium]|nr:GNAT family N-acetyltransferase [candidate division Zixibacteria bacterium]
MYEIELNETNREKLARAFENVKRVDTGIDCAVEGRMGKAYVDNPENPTVYKIELFPFSYFAGDGSGPAADEVLRNLKPHSILLAPASDWAVTALKIHGDNLIQFPRYSFSSSSLSTAHLDRLLEENSFRDKISRLGLEAVRKFMTDPEGFADIALFESPEDFIKRGAAFGVIENDRLKGIAYSSLVNSRAVEVSIYIVKKNRRLGMATALGCALLKYCLKNNLHPNWDAANLESCRLAEKLGYTATETYDAYYLKPSD